MLTLLIPIRYNANVKQIKLKPFAVFEKGHLFAIIIIQIESRDTLNLVCYANLLKTCWNRSSFFYAILLVLILISSLH